MPPHTSWGFGSRADERSAKRPEAVGRFQTEDILRGEAGYGATRFERGVQREPGLYINALNRSGAVGFEVSDQHVDESRAFSRGVQWPR